MKTWISAIAIAIALGLSQLLSAGQAFAHNEDMHPITRVMQMQFDTPEATLTVAPISVEIDYAVAAEGPLGADKRKLFDAFGDHSQHGQHAGHSESVQK